MNRRKAIGSLGAIAAGLTLLPACNDRLRLSQDDEGQIAFSSTQATWLGALSAAILPVSEDIERPEAFETFVTRMINEVRSPAQRNSFINGYNLVTDHMKTMFNSNLKKITPDQMISFFKSPIVNLPEDSLDPDQMQADSTSFVREMRDLTLFQYTTSREYMKDVLEYNIIPKKYQGCVVV
ncbi:MAG: gluconate 2-dehydrogenase subunit 3 family protein [Bacteroidota bacterium]